MAGLSREEREKRAAQLPASRVHTGNTPAPPLSAGGKPLAQPAVSHDAASELKRDPEVVERTVSVGQRSVTERYQIRRAEWLSVASHALPLILAKQRAALPKHLPDPDPFDAVDAVIAEADRRWPG